MLPPAPANFQRLGEARVGELADLHTLTLRFSQTTKITGISVTKDFKIEQGGSCVEGNVYEKGATCRLLVRFTPQGPGNRLGKITVTHSGSITPDAFGLGAYPTCPWSASSRQSSPPCPAPTHQQGPAERRAATHGRWRRFSLYRRHRQRGHPLHRFQRNHPKHRYGSVGCRRNRRGFFRRRLVQ